MKKTLSRSMLALFTLATACDASSKSSEFDPNKALGGVVYISEDQSPKVLGNGPLLLTDVVLEGRMVEVFVTRDATCKESYAEGSLFAWNSPLDKPNEAQSHHGMKILVSKEQTLCFKSSAGQSKLLWAGTRL